MLSGYTHAFEGFVLLDAGMMELKLHGRQLIGLEIMCVVAVMAAA